MGKGSRQQIFLMEDSVNVVLGGDQLPFETVIALLGMDHFAYTTWERSDCNFKYVVMYTRATTKTRLSDVVSV